MVLKIRKKEEEYQENSFLLRVQQDLNALTKSEAPLYRKPRRD